MEEALIFDWGGTVMTDFGYPGKMRDWEKVAWVPGLEPVLKNLSEMFLCCIATNAGASDTADMIAALDRIGARKFFHHFFSSKELHAEKPDPVFFLETARRMGVRPDQCLVIGDRYEKDIIGAHRAGMKSVLYHSAGSSEDFPLADAIIADMKLLPETITSLLCR